MDVVSQVVDFVIAHKFWMAALVPFVIAIIVLKILN